MNRKTLIFLLLFPLITRAQTPYFTQTSAVPLQLNPALVATDNHATLMLNYRRQQFLEDVSLQSTVFTGQYPLINSHNQRWGGVGITLLNDHSDDAQLFRRTQLEAAWAYNVTLAPRTYLSGGVQGGYHQQRLSTAGITTGRQYVRNVGFDPTADTGEDLRHTRSDYWNLGVGLHFYRTDARPAAMTYLGVAVQRAHRPPESFLEGDYALARRYVVQGGQRVFDNRRWTITPTVLWMREGVQSWLRAGAEYRYHFRNDNPLDPLRSGSVDFGTYYTDAQAVALSLRFRQPYFSAGFSYDIGTSRQAMQSATELTLAVRKTIHRRKPTPVVRNYSVGEVRKFYEKREAISPQPTPKKSQATAPTTQPTTDQNARSATDTPVTFSLKQTFEFAFNQAALTPEAQAYFDDFVGLMRMNPKLQLRVVGHTDNVGPERINLKVSLARAQSVKDYLVAQGIDKRRIAVDGVGSAQPLVSNDTAADRAKNRRVELIVTQ